MSEMVERVAEALAQSFRETVVKVSGDSWEQTGVTLPSKEVWERYARAAIEAMRKPTDPMLDAGNKLYMLDECWEAMIDAAIADPA
jgi:hypothetical protein